MRHFRLLLGMSLVLSLAAVAGLSVCVAEDTKPAGSRRPDVVYVPTPQGAVDKMLELAKVTEKDVLYDLGCGDGRIVLTAARKYKCKATGFDIDPQRIKDCMRNYNKEEKETQELVKFEQKNIFDLDLSKVDVVTLYLLPRLNVKLVPQLKKMKEGSRIVSHAFDMEGYKPDKKITVKTTDDRGNERNCTLYLWTIPLKLEKDDK